MPRDIRLLLDLAAISFILIGVIFYPQAPSATQGILPYIWKAWTNRTSKSLPQQSALGSRLFWIAAIICLSIRQDEWQWRLAFGLMGLVYLVTLLLPLKRDTGQKSFADHDTVVVVAPKK